MSEWISVKDKMPPENVDILCYASDGQFYVASYDRIWRDDDKFYWKFNCDCMDASDNYYTDIKYWMEIPFKDYIKFLEEKS